MKIARVFPRRTNASPDDYLAFFDRPGFLQKDANIDEVHISVTFSYDISKAEELAKLWEKIAPVKIGGPAMRDPGGDFNPGLYLKKGYVITSRGCPNNCWFCDVPKREGDIRELSITDGWNVLDSNLLACSEKHIEKVFSMLKKQPEKAEFTGGLEAKRLTSKHIILLWDLRPSQIFFAYDTPDDLYPLIVAGRKLNCANFTRNQLRCYVLIGYPKDTMEEAEKRLIKTWRAGFLPMAMLYRDKCGETNPDWRKFQRSWARPASIKAIIKKIYFTEERI